MTIQQKRGDARSEPDTSACKTKPFSIKNSSEENMGDGRKRTWFQSLQYENNTNALTGGRTDGLNADVAVMRTGYEPVRTKEIGIARGDEIGREMGMKTYRLT